jgi:diguanylate cyclase (GGDEF)-like protein
MTAQAQNMAMKSGGARPPLFILSFHHRDELNHIAERSGWQPISARRLAGVEGRFLKSASSVIVVDAREALNEARQAVRLLSDTVEANAAALLVLVPQGQDDAIAGFFQDGATHFLSAPFSDAELGQAIRFAERHAQRAGGKPNAFGRHGEEGFDGGSWRWHPGSRTVDLSPTLARKAGLGENEGRRVPLMELLRKLDAEGRKAARIAIDRLLETGESTAFAHEDVEGGARLAHHLRVDDTSSEIIGRTEMLAGPDIPAFDSRDPLTGVRDARAVRAWIRQQIAETPGEAPSMVALLLAVNRFDAINAAFGRTAGDAVLQAVARRIERLVDADNVRRMVARLAGAQFIILLGGPTSLGEGSFLAGQLVEAIDRPFVSGDHVITLGCRVGVVAASDTDDGASLLRRGSQALVEAKRGMAGPVRVLDAGSQSENARGDQLEVDLRRALDNDEIEIMFQPQVSVTTGLIVGVEALARWRHPAYGELGATTLFNVAERSDYLVQLSDHVQRKALAAAALWPESLCDIRLAINITAADIARPGFTEQFVALIATSGFDRGRVTVEVTEGSLIENLNGAATLLAQLREAGLRIAIDDFGTGYSSLAYLKALPLDYLKIDKRLCEDITGSPRDRIVVRSVIDMARSLGLGVIAEGVESQEQLDLLAKEGCTLYQGFLCSKPVESGDLVHLVETTAGH